MVRARQEDAVASSASASVVAHIGRPCRQRHDALDSRCLISPMQSRDDLYARLAGQKIAAGCDSTSTLKSGTRYSGEPAVVLACSFSPQRLTQSPSSNTWLLSQVYFLIATSTPYTRCVCSRPKCVIQCGRRDISVAGRSQLMGGDEAHIGQGLTLYLETAHA